jgi:hypothetical protein
LGESFAKNAGTPRKCGLWEEGDIRDIMEKRLYDARWNFVSLFSLRQAKRTGVDEKTFYRV